MWCVVIPTYNNESTIERVITGVRRHTGNIIVVNDGSTDNTGAILDALGVQCVRYGKNMGKGYALKKGLRKARESGFDYAITIDADGQHFADDIPVLAQAAMQHPGSLVVGCRNLSEKGMPSANTFANKFSNFWFRLQTGIDLPDTQTGFRLYPLKEMGSLRWITSRYESELEMLVYAAWRGIKIVPVKVRVYYPPKGMRVSHFRPVYDFMRISLLNSILCLIAVAYVWPAKLLKSLS